MFDLDLPIISPEASPEFRDATGCAEWLQALPLINVGPANGRVLDQLEELNCFALSTGERLRILELMRKPVTFVQAEHAKKFTSKAVPLLPALQTPATLIMPPGYYKSRRVIEVYANCAEKFLLSSLLERGSEYERCTYEPV